MTATPRVSVVIPAYFSDCELPDCLEALRRQTYTNFETIVVNSSPEERTGQLVTQNYPEVTFEQAERRLLPHAARNRGVTRARGELLAFTDPDCVPWPSWLENLVAAIDSGYTIVQGSMELDDQRWLPTAIHLVKWHALLPGTRARILSQVATGNACYRRDVWETVGPFEGEFFAGDAILSWRASEQGFALCFVPEAIVVQKHGEKAVVHLRERFNRGLEFGRVRISFWAWSEMRAFLYAMCLPMLPVVPLIRAAHSSARNGWFRRYLTTFPFQYLGQLAWCAGEALACLCWIAGDGDESH